MTQVDEKPRIRTISRHTNTCTSAKSHTHHNDHICHFNCHLKKKERVRQENSLADRLYLALCALTQNDLSVEISWKKFSFFTSWNVYLENLLKIIDIDSSYLIGCINMFRTPCIIYSTIHIYKCSHFVHSRLYYTPPDFFSLH